MSSNTQTAFGINLLLSQGYILFNPKEAAEGLKDTFMILVLTSNTFRQIGIKRKKKLKTKRRTLLGYRIIIILPFASFGLNFSSW